MEYSERELSDIAYQVYQDHSDLREADRIRYMIRHGTYEPHVPESIRNQGRAFPIKARTGAEKLERAASLLTDPDDVQIDVASVGTGQAWMRRREATQTWLMGGLRAAQAASPRNLQRTVATDLLTYDRTFLYVAPLPGAWGQLPEDRDLEDPAYIERLIQEMGEREPGARRRKLEALQRRYRLRHFPIQIQWVPATAAIAEYDHLGLACVFEFREMSVRRLLAEWRDDHGNPLAQQLQRQVREQELTQRDTCTVLRYADREHLSICLLPFHLIDTEGQTGARRHHGGEELVFCEEHGMGAVPYAVFHGRMTESEDPATQYSGWLDNISGLVVAKDNFLTQLGSVAHMAAFPLWYLRREKDANPALQVPGAKDKQREINIIEGGVSTDTMPGEEIALFPGIDATAITALNQTIDRVDAAMQEHTLGRASYGARSESGYMYAQQQSDSEIPLEPYEIGLSHGYADAARLMLTAGHVVITGGGYVGQGCGPIPVRYVSGDGVQEVTLTEEMAAEDWEINVRVKARPVGGRMAQLQTLGEARKMGLIDDEEMAIEVGNRHFQRTQQRNLVAGLKQHPLVVDVFAKKVSEFLLGAQPEAPALPDQLAVPPGAQGLVTDEEALARMGAGGPPGDMAAGGAGGLPSANAANMAPAPPRLSDQMLQNLNGLGAPGGGVAGEGRAVPNSMGMMDQVLGRRGQ